VRPLSAFHDRLFGRKVDPTKQNVFKWLPDMPPRAGEYVLVDGARCRVSRCRVQWQERQWTIVELRVKATK
jgi:hypothetical protein